MKKVTIEFDVNHLPVLVAALETYSRLRSGQVKMAMDEVYWDRDLSYDEGQYIERVIRYVTFPSNPQIENDGHGGFDDQYNNVYDEDGEIVEESDEWKRKKNRPHLDDPNMSFGVGCKELKDGTIAWEIKKTLDEYLHYERNDGYRKVCDVSGDGAMQYSEVSLPKVLNFDTFKQFLVPKKFQKKLKKCLDEKRYQDAWATVNKAFENDSLPRGSATRIIDETTVEVEKPYLIE